MNVEDFRLLYDYNAWANQRTLDSCAPLSEEQFTRDLEIELSLPCGTRSCTSSRREWIWLERWHGRAPTAFPNAADYPDLESVRGRCSKSIATDGLRCIAQSRRPATRDFLQANYRGRAIAAALADCLQHVANHGTYHRGQIATMLRQLGAKPVSTDLLAFYRDRAGRISRLTWKSFARLHG